MPRIPHSPLNSGARILRAAFGVSAEYLAVGSGLTVSQVQEILNGRRECSGSTLVAFAERLGAPSGAVDSAIELAVMLASGSPEGAKEGLEPDDVQVIAEAVRRVAAMTQRHLRGLALAEQFDTARRQADADWQTLLPLSPASRRRTLRACPKARSWALVERLGEESERVAPHDPRQCLALAELALSVAQRTDGSPPPFCDRLKALALAYLGNAQRVLERFAEAEATFLRSRSLWVEPAPDEVCPLDPTRRLDLEASLRRAQRRLEESRQLLEGALEIAPSGLVRARLLIKLGFVLEQEGNCTEAITALREALPLTDSGNSPRLSFAARFNLAVNLLHLGLADPAAPLVSQARRLAVESRNDLDLLRVDWLEARLLAARGELRGAIEALTSVLAQFEARDRSFDAALATHDLAVLLLESNDSREASRRVQFAVPIFQANGVFREELAAVRLFLEAIDRNHATAALAREAAEAWRIHGATSCPRRLP